MPQLQAVINEMERVALPQPLAQPRRFFKSPGMRPYNRLAVFVIAVNAAMGFAFRGDVLGSPPALSLAATINVALAVLIRQQHVVNGAFRLATRARHGWPISIRWALAKVYQIGGLHVGAAVSGACWHVLLTACLTRRALHGDADPPLLTVACALTVLLVSMVVTAMPRFRKRFHDTFEGIHRFGGWAATALFWFQGLIPAHRAWARHATFASPLDHPALWLLALTTVSSSLPWLRLRKVAVDIVRPSAHAALVHFDHGVTPVCGSGLPISRNPWTGWHAFASIPTPGRTGYRMVISRAGDWTASFIDEMPGHVWVKGVPTCGVGHIARLFDRVVFVATGSGIAPVLAHLLADYVPSHLVWVTRNPRETYGDQLVDEIVAVQPGARIWDTDRDGRPDLLSMAYAAYASFDAEAVICISNETLTWRVVHGLESRNVPAFGAIWDS
ncbi:hypothetical protein [Streptomyces sp. NPDC051776]|uniref:hypothetical protein n=1 Tax=Streptomyces sp. NPDC051776 TaxID=3155414 RepID=UPI003439B3F4